MCTFVCTSLIKQTPQTVCLRGSDLVEHRGLEQKSSDFVSCRNFEKMPILRGLQAPKILRHIKIYRKFS